MRPINLTKLFPRLYRIRRFTAALLFVGLSGAVWQCSLEEKAGRGISGHSDVKSGVAHGHSALRASRQCSLCHGAQLTGGESGEPSCFQCHGQTWDDGSATVSNAPADHSISNDGFRHHPSLRTPSGACTTCHGAALQGDPVQKTPNCYLCHGQLWD